MRETSDFSLEIVTSQAAIIASYSFHAHLVGVASSWKIGPFLLLKYTDDGDYIVVVPILTFKSDTGFFESTDASTVAQPVYGGCLSCWNLGFHFRSRAESIFRMERNWQLEKNRASKRLSYAYFGAWVIFILVSFLYILLGFDSSVPALLGSSHPYGA